MADKFWGEVFGAVSRVAAFPVALINGVGKAIDGDNFGDGINEFYDNNESTFDDIEEFGDKHNDTIKDVSKNVTGIVIGTIIGANVIGGKK